MKMLVIAATLLALPIPSSATACSPNNPEPFGPFLQRFSTEPRFALKRTLPPLQMLKWEYGLNGNGEDDSAPVKSQISRADYSIWQTLDDYMKTNKLTSVIDSQTQTTAVLKVFKDSTDWLTLYHFKSKNGCWFLWQYEDQSL